VNVDFGSVPDWLTVAGAFLALIFARAAARAAQQTNQHQAAQLDQLEEAERRRAELERKRQAGNLAFWALLIREDGYQPAIRIMNANRTPLYECRLYCATPWGATWTAINVVGPTTEPRIIQHFTQRVRELSPDNADFLRVMDANAILVSGTFRDALDQWWYSNRRKSLRRCRSVRSGRVPPSRFQPRAVPAGIHRVLVRDRARII
jgi:hypothetical protein